MKKERSTFPIFLYAAAFMLSLLLILGILTSFKTGISLFDKEVLSVLSSIFMISLFILGILALSVFITAIFSGKKTPSAGGSTLIKDGFLRYETRDEKGRKKKATVDITKIDRFLNEYSELYMIKGTKLFKEDKKAKGNANTLKVVLADDRKMSMNELSKTDKQLYDQICRFLDRIKNKDSIDLSFRMRKYAAEEDLVLSGRDTAEKLRLLARKIKDKEVKEKTSDTAQRIIDNENNIYDHSDRLRKLYDHYLPMLLQIVSDYITMEGHDKKLVDLSSSKRRLLDTLKLIDSVFLSFEKDEEPEGLDLLDADVVKVNALLEKNEK